jgi:hypothetical protein
VSDPESVDLAATTGTIRARLGTGAVLQMGTSVIRLRAVSWDIFRGIQPLRLAYPTYVRAREAR